MLKVAVKYFTLPHYRVPLFNAVQETGEIDLSIIYTPHEQSEGRNTGLAPSADDRLAFKQISVGSRRFGIGKFYTQPGSVELLKKGGYDVAFFQAVIYDWSSITGMMAARKMGLPVVIWSKGFAAESRRNALYNQLLFKKFYGLADVILPYGDQSIEYFENLGIPRSKIVEAHNTLDVESIAAGADGFRERGRRMREGLRIAPDKRIISSVGALTKKKRTFDLLQAFENLSKTTPDLHLVLGGAGPEREFLENYVKEHGLGESVSIMGSLPHGDDNALYAVSDVAAFCGGLGLGILQPMVLGAVVVGADERSPDAEALTDGVTGLRYVKADVRDLERQLARALNDSPLRGEILAKAIDEVLLKRSLKSYANSFIEAAKLAVQSKNITR